MGLSMPISSSFLDASSTAPTEARVVCPGGSLRGVAQEHFLVALVEVYALTGEVVEDEKNPDKGVEVDPTEDRALGVGETKGTPIPPGDPVVTLLIQSSYIIWTKKEHIFSGYAAVGAV